MSTNDSYLLDSISTNNLAILRALLEGHDLQIFSQVAKTGTPGTAAYLLSRYPPFVEGCPHFLPFPLRALNPTQYLARSSAFNTNVPVFRYLLDRYPSLLSIVGDDPRNVERILINAIDGGVYIWEVILEHDARWIDYEFQNHSGYMLEIVAQFGKKDLLEMLLERGAKTMREGGPILELAREKGAGEDLLELIMKYQSA